MSTTTTDGCSIEKILENDLISREIFAHLSLPDLLNISLVSRAWMRIIRCHVRQNLICDRNLPKEPSPCTSLTCLETELESMGIPHYTGIRIYLNRCSAHSGAKFSLDNHDGDDSYLETMFPNILNHLNLKHIWLWFSSEKREQVCELTVKLIQKLCQKHVDSLKKITVIIKVFPSLFPKRHPALLRTIFLEGEEVLYKNMKTLAFDCEYFREETQECLLDLIKASPKLKQIKCPNVDIVPEGWKHLVKEMVLNGDESRRWRYVDARNYEGKYKLKYLQAFNCNLQHVLQGFYYPPPTIFENLLWSSADSLKILAIRAIIFPQWSTNEKIPVLGNVQKLQIHFSLKVSWFLKEFGFICGVMLPGLKVVSVHHSSSMDGHIEPHEDQGQIIPNNRVRTLRLEGFNCKMDVTMRQFTKYFPHLTELHLIDCDGSVIPEIFNWKTLECIVFGGRNSYWTENYDHFIFGVESRDEMQKLRKDWSSGQNLENFVQIKPGLLLLTDLRRVYVMGGASPAKKRDEEEQVFLSKEVMSLVTRKMPQLAIRILKGYKDSVLTHLLEFDNGADNPWCPHVPHDVEQYFEYSL